MSSEGPFGLLSGPLQMLRMPPYELRGSLRRSVDLFRGHQNTCWSLQTIPSGTPRVPSGAERAPSRLKGRAMAPWPPLDPPLPLTYMSYMSKNFPLFRLSKLFLLNFCYFLKVNGVCDLFSSRKIAKDSASRLSARRDTARTAITALYYSCRPAYITEWAGNWGLVPWLLTARATT